MELRNCVIFNGYAYGKVYGNPRFKDGTSVVTSKIERAEQKDGYIEIKTKNSVYKGFPPEDLVV